MAAAEFAKSKTPDDDAPRAEAQRLAALHLTFSQTVERIERLVDLETATLQQYRPIDFSEFNHRKSHALLELRRAIRALGNDVREARARGDLERLSAKLKRNLSALEIHLKAVRQVCALIADAIQTEESDGTYTSSLQRRHERP